MQKIQLFFYSLFCVAVFLLCWNIVLYTQTKYHMEKKNLLLIFDSWKKNASLS